MAIVDQTTDEGIERVNDYMADDSFVTTVKDKTDIVQFPDGPQFFYHLSLRFFKRGHKRCRQLSLRTQHTV